MANVKRRVVEAAREAVVLNADDPLCSRLAENFPARRTTLFSLHRESSVVREHLERGGKVFCLVDNGQERIVKLEGERTYPVAAVADLPASLGGVLRYNIANALAAAALADGLGIASETIGAGLRSFDLSVEQSPGRFNVIMKEPFLLIADHAISPPAAEALMPCLAQLDVQGRRLCFCTSAGNRPKWHFGELGALLASSFESFVCYDTPRLRRGRAPGEIAALLKSALVENGVRADSISEALDFDSALEDLAWQPKPGDLIVALGSFSRRDIESLRARFASNPGGGPPEQ